MKALNEKELAVFAGFSVLGAPDPISGETSVTLEERKALYRALRIDHFEVTKDEFEAIEKMYDQGLVTIDAAVEHLQKKKPVIQQKIFKAVYNSVKVLAGGSEAKMARGDRKGSLDEFQQKLGISDEIAHAPTPRPSGHGHKTAPTPKAAPKAPKEAKAAGEGKKSSKAMLVTIIVVVLAAAGGAAFWYMKHR